jgi:hypothetical protein
VKKIQSLSFLVAMAIAVGMISWGSAAHAQTAPSADPAQQQPQTQPTPSPDMPPASQQTPSTQTPSTQTPPQTPDATTPESGSRTGSTRGAAAATDSQTFSGTVVKQGDKYILRDDSGQTYDIDHQDEVKKFEGKRVRVQGSLDPTGKKIMVN